MLNLTMNHDTTTTTAMIGVSASASCAVNRKKKPYKELTLKEKVQLIKLAEENAGLSQAAIAERYCIAKSNVCRILQRKREYLIAYESAGFAGNRKRKLKPADELMNLNEATRPNEGNETLRTHMYKTHHISRMFMCKCCNWAFPDKTSLHMHIHAKEEGKNVTVPVIGKGLTASERLLDPATFSIPQPTVISPTLPATTILPSTLPLPYFNPANLVASQAPTTNIPSPDDLARLRDRLVLNSLLAQQGLGMAAWLNNLPKPIPTTQPPTDVVQLLKQSNEEEEEEIINVVEKDVDSKIDEDEKIISDSKSVDFKPMSVEEKRTSDSPSENASLASVDGCSPAHTSSAHSPLGVFKKDLSSTPSAFHHLNVDSRPCLEGVGSSPSHVSPSETHSSVSPDGNCYDCQVYKTKLTISDNKCRYLESRGNTLQTEAASAQSQMTIAESALRQAELETVGMKQQNELLHRRLLDCQNQCVRFLQEAERISNPQAVMLFLNQLIQTTIIQ